MGVRKVDVLWNCFVAKNTRLLDIVDGEGFILSSFSNGSGKKSSEEHEFVILIVGELMICNYLALV